MVRDIGFCVGLPLAMLALAVVPVKAQANFRVVAQLDQPLGLAEATPGAFYTVAEPSNAEAVFSVTSLGTTTLLGTLPNFYYVSFGATASNGRFYGSTYASGGSVLEVFSVSANPNSLISYALQNILPILTQNLPDGTLLGTGASQSTGLYYLIKSDLSGNVTPIYQFPVGEKLPNNAIYGSDGSYYGVSWQQSVGGTTGTGGYIYKVTPQGLLTKLYTLPAGTFSSYGSNFVPILQGTDGNLYGATTTGGNGFESVYQITPSGQFTTLHSFAKGPGSNPQSLIQASDGNLYSASLGYSYFGGEISRITLSGQYTPLHDMSGNCECLIVQASDGVIYGTEVDGIFALNVGLPKPAPQALEFGPQQGPAGTRVRIWGYNLLGAAVAFNGVAAVAVSNSGANYVWATVPIGAATGPITITTPGGTSTTAASFKVE